MEWTWHTDVTIDNNGSNFNLLQQARASMVATQFQDAAMCDTGAIEERLDMG
jgi:hypothetical protein